MAMATPAPRRLDLLRSHVRLHVAKVLGLSPTAPVPSQGGFSELGMDSLTSVELRNALQTSLATTLPSTLTFDYPTLDTLVDYLAQEVLSLEPAAEPAAEPAQEPHGRSDLSGQLDQLTADQMAEMVRSRRREDGGFVEIGAIRHSGTNPTAAAMGLLQMLDSLDEPTRAAAAEFLAGMQNQEGGLRANPRIPVADLLSTFTGLVALAGIDAVSALDTAAALRFVKSLERPRGGFPAGGAEGDAFRPPVRYDEPIQAAFEHRRDDQENGLEADSGGQRHPPVLRRHGSVERQPGRCRAARGKRH